MLELSSLNFKVNTEDLERAHGLLKSLAPAMQGVSNASSAMEKSTNQSSKAADQLAKGAERTTKALTGVERQVQRQITKNEILRGEAIKLKDAVVKLDGAFSSSQAGQLASLQLAGATSEQYKKLAAAATDYNNITGANKFDDSISGLGKLKKEVKELTLIQELQAAGYKLSAKEVKGLTRDEEALTQSLNKGKITQDEFNKRLADTKASYVELSAKKALYIEQSKQAEDQIKKEARQQQRDSSMMMESAVNLFRQKEAASKQAADKQSQIDKQSQDSSDKLFSNRINFINEEIKAVNANRNAWREYYTTQGVLDKGAKPSSIKVGEGSMDKATSMFYKEQERQAKATAKAYSLVSSEMQRVDTVLSELNRNQASGTAISERHAASVARYANQLKSAGVTGQAAAAQLEAYRGKIQQIEALENKRAQNRLANALAPQISDVAVSIAGGMPLHLVMMQQGLQIRDLIGQSGVAAEKLQETFRNAGKNMVTSIGGTIVALGQLTGGALVDAGAAINGFASKTLGITSALDKVRYSMALQKAENTALGNSFAYLQNQILLSSSVYDKIIKVASVLTGVALAGTAVALGTVIYETTKLIGANNDLARELAMTGNVFGATYANSQKYIEGLIGVGVSTRDAMSIMQQMSAAGGMTADQMQMVGKAAADMHKYGGVAIEETVKQYAKLADDPVKALSELQIKTGMVTPGLVKLVEEMKKQGDIAGATGIAMQALADVHGKAVVRMKEDLNPLTLAWNDFFKSFSEKYAAFSSSLNATLSTPLMKRIENRMATIESDRASTGNSALYEKEYKQLVATLDIHKQIQANQVSYAQFNSDQEQRRKRQEEIQKKHESRDFRKEKALKDLEDERKFMLAQGTPLSEKAISEAKTKIDKDFADKDALKEQNKQLTYKESIMEKINDAYDKAVGVAKEYNDIERIMRDMRNDPEYKTATAKDIKEIEDLAKAKLPGLLLAKQEKADKDALAYSIESLSDAYIKAANELNHYNEVEKKWIDLQDDSKFLAASAEKQAAIRAEAEAYIVRSKAVQTAQLDEDSKQQNRELEIKRLEASGSGKAAQELKARYKLEADLADNNAKYLADVKTAYLITDENLYNQEMQRARNKYATLNQMAKARYDTEIYAMSDMLQRQKNFDAVVKRGFEGMGDALINFAQTGKISFGDMIESMLLDLVRLEMRMQMMRMYESAGGGSSGGILGYLQGLFKGGASSAVGAGTSMSQFDYASLSGFDGGGYTGSGMRIGGIDGKGGGLAILHPNETVIDHTKGQGMGSNVSVVIVNNSGAQVTQKESTDSRGNRKVEVVVGDMTAGEVQRSGSAVQRGIGNTFGMRPALIQR